MIHNVHERELPVSEQAAGRLIDEIAGPDGVWPGSRWPQLVLDGPLAVGADGGHGPIHYRCSGYRPGVAVEFTFAPDLGVAGTHTLVVLPTANPDTCVLRHVLTGRPRTLRTGLRWSLVIRWLHDALLEDLLDNAERAVGRPPAHPARWSPWVRLLRWFGDRQPRPSATPALR